jgi:hypothetical protein
MIKSEQDIALLWTEDAQQAGTGVRVIEGVAMGAKAVPR